MSQKITSSSALSPELQKILSPASLFEKEFSIDWIVELTGEKASQVLLGLEAGVQKGWLIKSGPHIFCFAESKKRAEWLIKLCPEEKDRLTRKIVELLMEELPEDNEKALTLSSYLAHMNNDEEKCRWLMKAGDINYRAHRYEEALKCYIKVLDDLSIQKGGEADFLYAETAIKFSKLSTATQDTRKVFSFLNEATNRAKEQNNFKALALLEMYMAKNEWLRSRDLNALKHFEQGWSLAKDIGDAKLLRSATTLRTHFLDWQGKFRETVKSYETSVPGVEKFPVGQFPLFAALMVAYCYVQTAQVSQGLGMMDAIRIHCRERNDQYMEAQAVFTIAASMLDIRNLNESFRFTEYSLEKASKEHNGWVQIMGRLMLSLIYYLQGDKKRSIVSLNGFLEKSRDVHVTVRPYPYFLELLWAMEEGKLPSIADHTLRKELYRIQRSENIFLKGVGCRYQAFLDKREGLPRERIMQSLNLSLRYLEESGSVIEVARTQIELAREYLMDGNEEKANEIALMASKIFSPVNVELIPEDIKPIVKKLLVGEDLLKEILRLGQEVAAIRKQKDLAQLIISTVNRITGAERGAIFLLDEEYHPPRLLLHGSKNLTPEEINHSGFSSAIKMIEEVAFIGKGRIMRMNPTEKSYDPAGEVISSRICVPMMLREKVVGVLYHDNRLLSSAFKESDLELLDYFAAQAAIAMDNARAYEEIKRLNQKLKEEKLYFEEQHLQNLHFDDIVGESPAITTVLTKVNQVAKTDTTILITGETGVGKELVARAIHRHSPRCEKPFIRVFCSALPDSLIPSELFGHEKGAFTGAIHRRIGRFELADGGTIFLDEIGDLPLEVQVRLLRVSQSKEFERVGGSETLRSDFRLVAATNRDLDQAVKAGKFRPDLYYRLNVFPIEVPPLRDRKEDIPLLGHYFLKIHATKMGKTFDGILKSEMDKLIKYEWPGNVRELENIIERGVILSAGPVFQIPELGVSSPEVIHPDESSTLKEIERRHILWALNKTWWKIRGVGGAAELLDIHPSTLDFRMKKLGIQRPSPLSRRMMVGKPDYCT